MVGLLMCKNIIKTIQVAIVTYKTDIYLHKKPRQTHRIVNRTALQQSILSLAIAAKQHLQTVFEILHS